MKPKQILRALARRILGDYTLYRIYYFDEDALPVRTGPPNWVFREITSGDELAQSEEPIFRRLAGYAGDDARGYALFDSGTLACVCWYWWGARYAKRNFWPLEERDAKIVDLATAPSYRKRGLATALLERSAQAMCSDGFERLYARIWHSNIASIRAVENAHWVHMATVIELYPLGLIKRIRWVRPVRRD